MTVSIVIPVYNAEATIERLCEQLIEELGRCYRLQIVLVNDASTDHSAAACQRSHERHPEVVDVITLSRHFGEHNAVMAGLNYAEGDYCVITDDGFQSPPSEVRKLIEEIVRGYDVVYACYGEKGRSWLGNSGRRLHNWVATHALGKPAELYLCSFKALSRFVVREVVRYTGPDPYLDAIILRTTRKIGVVETRHEPSHQRGSGSTVGKLLSFWSNMIATFSLYPLRLVTVSGAIMAVIGFTYGSYTFVAWILPDSIIKDPDTYQTLKATQWFFRGLTLLSLGIVGEYVGRIYMNLNHDPQFIVRGALPRRAHQPPGRPPPPAPSTPR